MNIRGAQLRTLSVASHFSAFSMITAVELSIFCGGFGSRVYVSSVIPAIFALEIGDSRSLAGDAYVLDVPCLVVGLSLVGFCGVNNTSGGGSSAASGGLVRILH